MFCPKCGSSRKTSGQRFCTRCGLNLALPRLQPLAARHAAPTLRMIEEPRCLNTKPLTGWAAGTQPVPLARPTTPEAQQGIQTSVRVTASKRNTTLFWLCLLVLPVALLVGMKVSISSSHAQNLQIDAGTPLQISVPNPVATPALPTATPTPEPLAVFWAVIADETRLTFQAEQALGALDEASAEIAPGGQLALAYTAGQFFYNGPGADVHLTGPANEQVAYLVFVRATPTEPWQRIDINRTCLPRGGKGHDMGHHGLQRASQLLIRNLAATPLRLDSVSVNYSEAVAVHSAHAH